MVVLHAKDIVLGKKYSFPFDMTKEEIKTIRERILKLKAEDASPIDGWMDIDELEWLYDTAQGMETVVEIGAWEGRSTIALLEACRGTVFAVDPWKGNGGSYSEFIYNTSPFENLVIMKMPSVRASSILNGTEVDMVFIDGDHNYTSIRSDIDAWLPRTKKIICGHDYADPLSPGVKIAVDETFGDVELVSSIWYKKI